MGLLSTVEDNSEIEVEFIDDKSVVHIIQDETNQSKYYCLLVINKYLHSTYLIKKKNITIIVEV